ncbi:MAG: hypothetical protein JW874_16255 [Spirochaetales bacterium]|nr:hypothetical protein [Spirochaetales bacterium]
MKKIIFLSLICVLFTAQVMATSLNGNENIDSWNSEVAGQIRELTSDENGDGIADYILYYTSKGQKIAEKMDFNKDGIMDDFYFYINGVLKFRQIDSNFDKKVDIWVYINRGVYIGKYERDTDFDGTVDFVRDYDKGR